MKIQKLMYRELIFFKKGSFLGYKQEQCSPNQRTFFSSLSRTIKTKLSLINVLFLPWQICLLPECMHGQGFPQNRPLFIYKCTRNAGLEAPNQFVHRIAVFTEILTGRK